MGEQPIALIMADLEIKPKDLVSVSDEHLTHKMVTRACKGRLLTPKTKAKVLNALNRYTDKNYRADELFNY